MASKIVGNLIVNLAANIASFESSMRTAQKVADRNSKKMQRSLQNVETRLNNFASAAQTAFAVIGSGVAVRSIVNASIQMERINNALRVATGSSEAAANEFNFVRQEAARLGLDLEGAAHTYAQLSAAAKGTALQGRETRDIFVAISEASTVLGLSADQARGALRAIEQMISKGNVQAEELRGQLGERLPGAFQIAARAMGVTTEKLNDMLEQGEVTAEDMLPKLAAELRKTFGPEVQQAANGTQQSINRMNTALFEFKNQLADGGIIDGFTAMTSAIGTALQHFRPMVMATGAVIQENLESIRFAFETVITTAVHLWEKGFGNIASAFASFLAGMRAGILKLKELAASVGEKIKNIPGFGDAGAGLEAFGNSGTPGLDAAIEKLREAGGESVALAEKLRVVAQRHRDNIALIQDTTTQMIAGDLGIGQTIAPAIEESGKQITATLDTVSGEVEELATTTVEKFDFMAEAGKEMAGNIQSALADFFYEMNGDIGDLAKNFVDAMRRMLSQVLAFKALSGMFGGTAMGDFMGMAAGHAAIGGMPSGPTIVGEHGPELLNLPKGSKVTPNSKIGGITNVIHVNAQGAVSAGEVVRMVIVGVDEAVNRSLMANQRGYVPA